MPEPVGPVTRIAPYGLVNDASKRFERGREEAEVRELQQDRVLAQDSEHDALSVDGGQRRDAEVHPVRADGDGAVPVLRATGVGDVHLGHDLEAADERGLRGLRAAHHLVKHAVHPEPHAQVVLLGLDVDVGGAVGDRLLDDVVDELDRGRFRADLGELGQVVLGKAVRADEGVGVRVLGDTVERLDGADDVVLGRDRGLDVEAGDDAQVVEGEHVLRVGHRHEQRVVGDRDRHERVAHGELARNRGNSGHLRGALAEVDVLDADLARHDREHGTLGGIAEVDEHAAERASGGTVHLQRVVELRLAHHAGPHEQLAQPLTCLRHLRRPCSQRGARAVTEHGAVRGAPTVPRLGDAAHTCVIGLDAWRL